MTTYYANGIHYGELSDLLSDGWPEDKLVQVYTGTDTTLPPEYTTIAQLREKFQSPAVYAKLHRVVAKANEGFAERRQDGSVRYAVAMITEDEPGWTPGTWQPTLAEAQEAADTFNRAAGHTTDVVHDVVVSSMIASRVR